MSKRWRTGGRNATATSNLSLASGHGINLKHPRTSRTFSSQLSSSTGHHAPEGRCGLVTFGYGNPVNRLVVFLRYAYPGVCGVCV